MGTNNKTIGQFIMSTITLYPLGDYNKGVLNPFTIDLGTVSGAEEYKQEVAKGLYGHTTGGNVTSTKCLDCDHVHIASIDTECEECGSEEVETKQTDEEWIVCDYDDVPKRYVGEYDLDADFFEYKDFLENTYMDKGAVDAGLYLDIPLESIEEAYAGEFKSDADFAENMAEQCGLISDDAKWPHTCIDWERAALDLMMDYSEEKGYYFSHNW
jgi:antirestriction protein